MKKLMLSIAAVAAIFTGCTDSGLFGKDNLAKYEEMSGNVNNDISSIQTIVKSLHENNYVTSVSPDKDGTGYTVVFNSARRATVKAGNAASCPWIGVDMDSDGLYYWTMDGEWLLDAENGKIPVKGQNNADSANPQCKIEDGFWHVSCDGGKTWQKLDEAEPEDNASLFKTVGHDDENVSFVLQDGTELKAARYGILDVDFDMEMPVSLAPNSAVEVGYAIKASAKKVTVNVAPSADLTAEIFADNMFSGKIRIQSGDILDAGSKVVVKVEDGENSVEKTLTFVPTGPVFELSPKEVNVPAKGGSFEVVLLTNIGYKITSVPDWVKEVEVKDGEVPYTKIHVFNAAANELDEPRTGMISLCNDNQVCLAVAVIQRGRLNMERDDFHHRSVAMRFTADWCGYCPNMASAFETAAQNMPDRLEVLSVHCDGGLYFKDCAYWLSQYAVPGFPTGIIDGRMLVENYDKETIVKYTEQYAQETENTYSTVTGIALSSAVKDRKMDVTVETYIKKADSYLVTTLLVEDNIVAYQADFYNGNKNDYVHNGVVRVAVSNVKGEVVKTTADNQVKTFSYSVEVPKKYNLDNMRVVVIVQRAFGSQPVIQSGKYGDCYIDNSASAKVGETLEVKVK